MLHGALFCKVPQIGLNMNEIVHYIESEAKRRFVELLAEAEQTGKNLKELARERGYNV